MLHLVQSWCSWSTEISFSHRGHLRCCFALHRYEFTISIPSNHDRRLDLTSRVINAPDAKIAPAEGVLGQTLKVLYGDGPLDSAFDQADVMEIWDPEEADHIHHSAKLEDFLIRNYHVSSLFASDAARSNFQRGLAHATFQVILTQPKPPCANS